MEKSKIKELSAQKIFKVEITKKNVTLEEKKIYNYIDINLDKAFLNKYFQEYKKK